MKITTSFKQIASLTAFVLLALGLPLGLAENASALAAPSPSATTSTASASLSSLIANGSSTSVITVQLKDASGNNLTTGGATVTFTLSTSNGSIGSTTDVGNGTYRATYTSGTTAGSITITPRLSGTSFSAANRPTITLTAGPASSAAITTGPSTTVISGSALATQPVIRIVDANGNAVTSSTVDVVASIASGSGTLGGTTTVRAVAGVARFTNLVISGIAGIHTLRFTPTSLTSVVSGNITTFPAAASVLSLTIPAAGAINGESFTTQPQITIQDSYSNAVNSSATVTATVSAGATLVGTTTATAYLGVASFSNLGVIGSPGTPYTITYTISVPSTITTDQSITPTAATQAGLSSLAINLGIMSPAFNTDTLYYSVSVSSAVSSISFTPTFASALASGTFDGAPPFTSGAVQTYTPTRTGTNDPFNIVVTAQDGLTFKTYQITVTKVITTVTTTSTKPTSPKPTPTPSPTKATTQPIKVPTVSLTPKITSLSTTTGTAGSSVIITGTNLAATTSVRLSGKSAVIVSRSDTQLEVTVPSGASSGVFSLLTPKGSASSVRFTVTP